jgi:hypothetical protein
MPEFRLQVLQDNFAAFIAGNGLAPAAIDGHRAEAALSWFAGCNATLNRMNSARRIMGRALRAEPAPEEFNLFICWYNIPRNHNEQDAAVATNMVDLGTLVIGPQNLARIATANYMRLRLNGPGPMSKDFHWNYLGGGLR